MGNFVPPPPQLWVEEIELLKESVAQLVSPSNIVEIGTAQGGGFHIIASARRDVETVSLHSYDPHPGTSIDALIKIHKNSFSHAITSLAGASQWRSSGRGGVNLLIIDGSHTLDSVHQDYSAWTTHMITPCRVLFHDYDSEERDGASHPGVRVFCDALIHSSSQDVQVMARAGRYLLIEIEKPPRISLVDLKTSFKQWIAGAMQVAAGPNLDAKSSVDTLFSQLASHSRFRIDSGPLPSELERKSDFAFILNAASQSHVLHELLLSRTADSPNVLKWLEYLDMFLHARKWSSSALLQGQNSPILKDGDACNSILDLSELCADISILVGIVESLFKNIRT